MTPDLPQSVSIGEHIHQRQESYSRRSFCRGAAVGAVSFLAGCSGIIDGLSGSQPDLVVFNKQDTNITASIEVTNRSNEEMILSKSVDINSRNAEEFSDTLPSSGEFTITVETTDGLTGTHEWRISSEEQSMQVRVKSSSIDFNLLSP